MKSKTTNDYFKKGLIALVLFTTLSCYNHSLEELSQGDDCHREDASYKNDVRPILNRSCSISGCHSTTPLNTFQLVEYEDVKAQADNGLLLKTIKHESGVSAMPKSASKLTDCEISKITSWVSAGAKNN